MPQNDGQWGWTSYSKRYWEMDDGRKLYEGRFLRIDTDFPVGPRAVMEKFKVLFLARRPVLAMREIVTRLNAGEQIPSLAEIN